MSQGYNGTPFVQTWRNHKCTRLHETAESFIRCTFNWGGVRVSGSGHYCVVTKIVSYSGGGALWYLRLEDELEEAKRYRQKMVDNAIRDGDGKVRSYNRIIKIDLGEVDNRRHAVYRFWSAEGALLYVGLSVNAFERFKQHKGSKDWIQDVASVTIEWHENRERARVAEARAIREEEPIHNEVRYGGH